MVNGKNRSRKPINVSRETGLPCTWDSPQCYGRALHLAHGCTCEEATDEKLAAAHEKRDRLYAEQKRQKDRRMTAARKSSRQRKGETA